MVYHWPGTPSSLASVPLLYLPVLATTITCHQAPITVTIPRIVLHPCGSVLQMSSTEFVCALYPLRSWVVKLMVPSIVTDKSSLGRINLSLPSLCLFGVGEERRGRRWLMGHTRRRVSIVLKPSVIQVWPNYIYFLNFIYDLFIHV
jgi:hypothetical protein